MFTRIYVVFFPEYGGSVFCWNTNKFPHTSQHHISHESTDRPETQAVSIYAASSFWAVLEKRVKNEVTFFIFCALTNQCTIISQIITLLHVSTLSVSSSRSLSSIPCKVTQVFQMQLLVIQFTINPLAPEFPFKF